MTNEINKVSFTNFTLYKINSSLPKKAMWQNACFTTYFRQSQIVDEMWATKRWREKLMDSLGAFIN